MSNKNFDTLWKPDINLLQFLSYQTIVEKYKKHMEEVSRIPV